MVRRAPATLKKKIGSQSPGAPAALVTIISMASLEEYEAEYYGHVQAAQEKLALAESSGSGTESGRAACAAAERAAEAAKDVVQLMELEGR